MPLAIEGTSPQLLNLIGTEIQSSELHIKVELQSGDPVAAGIEALDPRVQEVWDQVQVGIRTAGSQVLVVAGASSWTQEGAGGPFAQKEAGDDDQIPPDDHGLLFGLVQNPKIPEWGFLKCLTYFSMEVVVQCGS